MRPIDLLTYKASATTTLIDEGLYLAKERERTEVGHDTQIHQRFLENAADRSEMVQQIKVADPFFVKREFALLAEEAAEVIPQDATLALSSFHSRSGFIFLDNYAIPYIDDYAGEHLQFDTLDRYFGVVQCLIFVCTDKGVDFSFLSGERKNANSLFVHSVLRWDVEKTFTEACAVMHKSHHNLDHAGMLTDGDREFYRYEREHLMAYMWAIISLMAQRLASHDKVQPDRTAYRRALRIGIEDPSPVNVVSLRLPDSSHNHLADDDHESNVVYSHRWMVRGHWRNQWYPSLGEHKPKYVPSYVKGPEHAPLVVKDALFIQEK